MRVERKCLKNSRLTRGNNLFFEEKTIQLCYLYTHRKSSDVFMPCNFVQFRPITINPYKFRTKSHLARDVLKNWFKVF